MNMRFVQTAFKDTPGAAAAMKRVRALMEERLAAKPELRDVLIPEWNVGCRRRECRQTLRQREACWLTFLNSNTWYWLS